MDCVNSYDIREINLADVKKVDDNYLLNETCAKARQQFIEDNGHVDMMVLSASFELLLRPEIYDALRASGVETAQAIVVTTPEDANQHIRNLFGMVPTTTTGKADWLEANQCYYKEGGAGYFLRMEQTTDEDKSLKRYLGAFVGLSHTSVQKLLDISRSEGGAALLRDIDDGKCSLDRAYKICKTGTSANADDLDCGPNINDQDCSADNEASESAPAVKPGSPKVMGGNTPGHKLEQGAESSIAMRFAEMTQELAELLNEPSAEQGYTIKANKDRKGALESYTCTHETTGGVLIVIFKPNNKKEVKNGNE